MVADPAPLPTPPQPSAGPRIPWLRVLPEGLAAPESGFAIDPLRPVPLAVITHGHSDHARSGHGRVVATPETLAIMAERLGAGFDAEAAIPLPYGQSLRLGEVTVSLHPAGHVLGSAQIRMQGPDGRVVVVTGDFKRSPDPSCAPFQPIPCDVLVTEATFGLPVFVHPPITQELQRLLAVQAANPERAILIGVYALGKAQRLIASLRQVGYQRPIWLHGALIRLTELYRRHGVDLGETPAVSEAPKGSLKGEIVLAPPSALQEVWSRRLPDPISALASGWMRVRARARQRRVDLPLVISDHADWPELLQTIQEVDPKAVWVTHGQEDALVHTIRRSGRAAEALALIGYEDEDAAG